MSSAWPRSQRRVLARSWRAFSSAALRSAESADWPGWLEEAIGGLAAGWLPGSVSDTVSLPQAVRAASMAMATVEPAMRVLVEMFMMVPSDGFRTRALGGDRGGRIGDGSDTPEIPVAAMVRRCHCVKRLDLVIDVSPAVLGGLLVVVIIEERCPGQEEARMQQTPELADLVHAAQEGDQAAWNALVDRFLPLVTAVVRRFRLSSADADDVNQTVWLRLVEHLDEIREPRAVPGWLVTTTRNEALRVIKRRARDVTLDPHGRTLGLLHEVNDMDEGMMRAERSQALRDALLELSPARRELLTLLLADPPMSYDEISSRLGIPIGSIGPTRARALEQLRNTDAMRALMASATPASEARGDGRDDVLDRRRRSRWMSWPERRRRSGRYQTIGAGRPTPHSRGGRSRRT